MAGTWKPDLRVIRLLEKEIKKTSSKERILVGTRILTWRGVLREVKQGTNFGKSYHQAILDSLRQPM